MSFSHISECEEEDGSPPLSSAKDALRAETGRTLLHCTADDDVRAIAAALALCFFLWTLKVGLILWYITANKVSPWFRNPPGYSPIAANVKMMLGDAAGGGFGNFGANTTVEGAVANGTMFYGMPDKEIGRAHV